MAAHKSKTTKGDRGIDFAQSAIIFHCSRTLVPIGSRKYITVSSQLTCVYCVTFASTHLLGHGESTKTYLTLFLSAGEKGQPEIRLRLQATMLSTGYFFLPLPPTTRAPRPSLRLRARSKFLVPPCNFGLRSFRAELDRNVRTQESNFPFYFCSCLQTM